MSERDRDNLVEQLTSAWRPRDTDGGLRGHPAFYDLDPEARERAATVTAALRLMEAALDPDGLSTTAHAVLARITPSRPGVSRSRSR